VPEGLGGAAAAAVQRAIEESFVAGFRIAMYIASGLAVASALAAAVLIEGKGERASPEIAHRHEAAHTLE
jgi:hypothetical protein